MKRGSLSSQEKGRGSEVHNKRKTQEAGAQSHPYRPVGIGTSRGYEESE